MKEIKLKQLVLDNFKGVKHREINFNDKASIVRGKNATGKTTVFSGYLWALFDKDEFGNSATNVRPHDENGKDIDFVDISVEATFDVDGEEISIKKTQSQKWIKKRGTQEQVFSGNENKFEVCGIPKSQKDYKAFVEETFCDEDTFLFGSNVNSFFKLDTKKRRTKLVSLVGDITDSDVIAQNGEFSCLETQLKVGTVDELLKRSKGTIKTLNESLETIPVRIDELEKTKVDIDVAELELEKSTLEKQVAEIDEKILDADKLVEVSTKLNQQILDVKSKLNAIADKHNTEQMQADSKRNSELAKYNSEISIKEMESDGLQSKISLLQTEVDSLEIKRGKLANDWKIASERVFDDSSLVCSYCGQEYPGDKKNDLRAEFESHKAQELKEIETQGMTAKELIDDKKSQIEKLVKLNADTIEEMAHLVFMRDKLEQTHLETTDCKETDEYKSLLAELETLESKKSDSTDIDEMRRELNHEKSELLAQINVLSVEIGKSENNVTIDERISELQTELRATSQKIANEQAQIDLLERFNVTKMEMLTQAVNKYFDVCRVVLFETQINGGVQDVCKITVNGSSYEGSLNHGDRILADIDLLNAFQKMNDVAIPIFADDTESVDADRLPTEVRTQTIFLRRDDNKELEVC